MAGSLGELCEVRNEMRNEGKREEWKGGGVALFLVVVLIPGELAGAWNDGGAE